MKKMRCDSRTIQNAEQIDGDKKAPPLCAQTKYIFDEYKAIVYWPTEKWARKSNRIEKWNTYLKTKRRTNKS